MVGFNLINIIINVPITLIALTGPPNLHTVGYRQNLVTRHPNVRED